MTRKILLAVLLALGLLSAPAPLHLAGIAHAQTPIPAEPDTERRTHYTAAASSGPFAVGFDLYGDGTDYANWVKVYVNGVELTQSGSWTLSTTSGSLATLARPITNAQITFTAPQTGTVDIVGSRRPRRTAQFAENRGVTAHDLNQVFTDLWMTERERWDRFTRIMLAPPGETIGPLPSAASRANAYLGFDSVGNPIATSAQGPAGPTGATGPAGTNGSNGTNGLDGADPGVRYSFDTSTTMANPGAGKYRFDNATLASATNLAISAQTAESGNPNLHATLVTWDGSTSSSVRGYILIKKVGAPQNIITAIISGAKTDNTTWLEFPITVLSTAGTITASDNVSVQFYRTGDQGSAGAGSGDVIGPATNTDTNIPQWNGTNSKTLKNGLPVSSYGAAVINGASKTAHAFIIGNGTGDPSVAGPCTNGQLAVGQTSADPSCKTVGGDATMDNTGSLTVTKTNGAAFAASATTDTTNAGNISSGLLAPGRIGASAASHGVPIDVAGTSTYKVIPDCQDTLGNHINYTQSTDAFSCGTSGGGGTTAPVSVDGFRLSISTGVPVLGAAVSASTSIYITPYTGDQIALYSGGSWTLLTCSEFTIPVTNSQSVTSTNGNSTLVVTDATQLIAGMKVSGTGIAANTTISSITDATHIVMNNAATGSGTNTITFKVPADTGLDIYVQNNSGSCKGFMASRGAINTAPSFGTQDGINTLNGDTTKRWIGVVVTSATDGQVDWSLNGQRRYRVFNYYNSRFLRNTEAFSSSGTWYKPVGIVQATADVAGGGGSAGTAVAANTPAAATGGPGGRGGRAIKTMAAADLSATETVTSGGAASSSSFGSHVSATGGGNGGNGGVSAGVGAPGSVGSDGSGSSGDFNLTGGGPPGASTTGFFFDSAAGTAASGQSAQGGAHGWVIVDEIVAY